MIIDFDTEKQKIISGLKMANGYMDCEMIISNNINQYHYKGISDASIEAHLRKLQKYLNEEIVINKDPYDCIRFKYVTHIMGRGTLRQLINKKKRNE
jgi:hypothetical protein